MTFQDRKQNKEEAKVEKESVELETAEMEIKITHKEENATSEEEARQLINEPSITETPRRSRRENKGVPPLRFDKYAGMTIHVNNEPKTIEKALKRKDKDDWEKALDEEYRSLITNKTWKLVKPPEDAKILGCKWVFKLKRDEEGKIARYKARSNRSWI